MLKRTITMNTKPLQYFSRFATTTISAMVAIGLCGCALTKDHIALNYTPQQNVAKVAGAEEAGVVVSVADTRAVRDRVGSKKNGYGMETAEIIATNDVALVLSKALETELSARGFKIQPGSAKLDVELNKCLNDFKMGMWSGSAIAELVINVQLKKADGTIAYTRLLSTEAQNTGIQLSSGENAKIALERAFQNSIRVLMEDKQFIDTLLTVGKIGGVPAAK